MQEKNEFDSFFDLKFEGEGRLRVAALVTGPKCGAGLHRETDSLVLVKAAALGVAARDEFDEALGTP